MRQIRTILLIQPPYTYYRDIPKIVEMPLGICYIAAVLRNAGFKVMVLDALAEKYDQEIHLGGGVYRAGLTWEEIRDVVIRSKPDLVGVSCLFTVQYPNAREVLAATKSVDRQIVTIMGGMHATVEPEKVLRDQNLDFVIRGEAEDTFTEFIDRINRKLDYTGLDGLCYRNGDAIHVNEKRSFIEKLDRLPFPARDLLPVEKYFSAGLAHGFLLKNRRNVNIITSRGCPFNCVFCTVHNLWGRRFRPRSPKNVLDEIELVKQRYNIHHLQFEDDNLGLDVARAREIFQGMIERKFNLLWNTPNGVAAWRLDEDTLELMKRAGCYQVKFGIESGSQEVLDTIIKKPQSIERIRKLIQHCNKISLSVGGFFVVGLPGETKKQMQESFDFPMHNALDSAEYSAATPYPGSPLYAICIENGYLDKKFAFEKLYARRAVINTGDFSARWLEAQIKMHYRRYILSNLARRPLKFIKYAIEMARGNPGFVARYLRQLIAR